MAIPIFRDTVYIVQGPKNVNKLLQSGQVTVNRSYGLVLQRCFGMNKKSADAYYSDTSGSRLKPLAGVTSRTEERILHLTHENLVTGLLQNGLEPTMDRLMSHLEHSLEEEQQGHDVILGCYNHGWRDEPDLAAFFQQHLGSSIIKALFGDLLLDLNPDFVDDLWKYDEDIIRTIQRIPSFWIPEVYKLRARLIESVKRWHSKADCPRKANDSYVLDLVSNWGTKMMMERFRMLLGAAGQDKSSVASADLALIWAYVNFRLPLLGCNLRPELPLRSPR